MCSIKFCSRCKLEKDISLFSIQINSKTGYQNQCKACNKDRTKDYWRNCNLKRRYGITELEYQQMLKEQKRLCFLCEKQLNSRKLLGVDHCHKTGKVRKLLCQKCNMLVGWVETNTNMLTKLKEYLHV